jgi:hypothetical protein
MGTKRLALLVPVLLAVPQTIVLRRPIAPVEFALRSVPQVHPIPVLKDKALVFIQVVSSKIAPLVSVLDPLVTFCLKTAQVHTLLLTTLMVQAAKTIRQNLVTCFGAVLVRPQHVSPRIPTMVKWLLVAKTPYVTISTPASKATVVICLQPHPPKVAKLIRFLAPSTAMLLEPVVLPVADLATSATSTSTTGPVLMM